MNLISALVTFLFVGQAFAATTLTCKVSAVADGRLMSSNPLKLKAGDDFVLVFTTTNAKEPGLLTLGKENHFVATTYRSTFDSQWIDFAYRPEATDFHPIYMRVIMATSPFEKFFSAKLYHRMDGGGLPSANLTCVLAYGKGGPFDPRGKDPQDK